MASYIGCGPGLDMSHGFLQHIIQRQHARREEDTMLQTQELEDNSNTNNCKPQRASQQLYRPPPARGKDAMDIKNEKSNPTDNDRQRAVSPYQFQSQSFTDEKFSMDEVDISRYMEEAHPYIEKAIDDPGTLNSKNLREVGCIIINRAYEDPGYHTVAAKLCKHIAMKEYANQEDVTIPNFIFRKSIIEHCNALFKDYERMRNASMDFWFNYVKFLSEVYLCLCFKGGHLADLSNLLYKVLDILINPPCVENVDEVELLVSVTTSCGKYLRADDRSHMYDLMFAIRELFLDDPLKLAPSTKEKMLPLIELHACNWGTQTETEVFF